MSTVEHTFYGLFSGTTRKFSSGLYGTKADITGTDTDNLAWRQSFRTNQ